MLHAKTKVAREAREGVKREKGEKKWEDEFFSSFSSEALVLLSRLLGKETTITQVGAKAGMDHA